MSVFELGNLMRGANGFLVGIAITSTLAGCRAQVAVSGVEVVTTTGGASTASGPSSVLAPTSVTASESTEVRIVFDEATQELRYRAAPGTTPSVGAERAPSFGAFPIFFELDRDRLKSDATTVQTLAALRTFLLAHPETNLRIEGHTDSRAGDTYNRDLSSRRAVTVMNWLADHGVDGERLEAIGHGEGRPRLKRTADDALGVEPTLHQACSRTQVPDSRLCEEQVWSRNRRVEFHVTKGAEVLAGKVEPRPAPEPPRVATPSEPPTPPRPCALTLGPRLAALGPNSFGNIGLSLRPGVCWLELAASGGVMFNTIDDAFNNLAIPLLGRGRFWIGEHHALVPEMGAGATLYRQAGGAGSAYQRAGTVLLAHLGIGYGFRPSLGGGPSFGIAAGAALQAGTLPSGNAPEFDAVTDSLLPEPAVRFTNGVELAPYGELWMSLAFELAPR
ncbi:MAG: OmpA family protein [Deltaproteobacteria bacterium]|nr:OmpA family protein [Deltaproteobacteria bacterium]